MTTINSNNTPPLTLVSDVWKLILNHTNPPTLNACIRTDRAWKKFFEELTNDDNFLKNLFPLIDKKAEHIKTYLINQTRIIKALNNTVLADKSKNSLKIPNEISTDVSSQVICGEFVISRTSDADKHFLNVFSQQGTMISTVEIELLSPLLPGTFTTLSDGKEWIVQLTNHTIQGYHLNPQGELTKKWFKELTDPGRKFITGQLAIDPSRRWLCYSDVPVANKLPAGDWSKILKTKSAPVFHQILRNHNILDVMTGRPVSYLENEKWTPFFQKSKQIFLCGDTIVGIENNHIQIKSIHTLASATLHMSVMRPATAEEKAAYHRENLPNRRIVHRLWGDSKGEKIFIFTQETHSKEKQLFCISLL